MKRRLLFLLSVCVPLLLFALYTLVDRAYGGAVNSQRELEDGGVINQSGPAWFNPAWNYRRPIIITNTNDFEWLSYQVLITLNEDNFDFSLAKADGADIRFTLGQGTIPIPYWIESWDSQNQFAYVWVNVPGLDPYPDTSTIYLYYNNPNANPASNGADTFDGFDDEWGDFIPEQQGKLSFPNGIESPFGWLPISGDPQVSDGYLVLGNGTGIRSTGTYQNLAVGFKANFGTGNGNEWVGFYNEATSKRTMIGDRPIPADPTELYLRNYNTVEFTTPIPRLGGNGWHDADHIFEVRWCTSANGCGVTPETKVDVDHGSTEASLTSQVPDTALPVTLHNNNSGAASQLKVAWIYVRQYSNAEPTYAIGEKQGLVKLEIAGSDAPDPLPQGKPLTYELIITNSGTIDAPFVVVTDTLPADVQIGEISTSQGTCEVSSVISCDLNTLMVDQMANISIVVTPTLMDGIRINTAMVGSPGYELDFSDNTNEQMTLVDSVPPVLNWEKPVHNGGLYTSYGGDVLLEASAADEDDLVANVEFLLWDHLSNPPHGSYVSLGIDDIFPYQALFDSNILVPNVSYQLFVRGTDRAGNISNPQNPIQRIYITRRIANFMPLVIK